MTIERLTPSASTSSALARGRVRRRLLASGATAACLCAVMLAPASARAQTGYVDPTAPVAQLGHIDAVAPVPMANGNTTTGFQGSPEVVVPGSATVLQTATQDFITVNGAEAIINWTPYERGDSGAIDFLPAGNAAFFSGTSDFTVLNRIIPLNGQDVPVARLIQLNGQIQSFVGNAATQTLGPGGNVWFYTPGGILVGAGAVINVGSLVLTTRDIDTTGGLFGAGGTIRFRDPKVAGSETASISIDPLARITARRATPGSSYIALVAPRIVQAGTIQSDGSVALVAAEEADIRINQGLFDINVTVGTGDSNGVVHTGSTTGAAETGNGYASRVYMVAVPKNQALTMLLSGTAGFETATSASIDANGAIVLSAGHNIANGDIGEVAATGVDATAGFTVNGGRFINELTGAATHDIRVEPGASGVRFEGDATLDGARSVSVRVDNSAVATFLGDLLTSSASEHNGGRIDISVANGGQLNVSGLLSLDASGFSETRASTGGTANLSVQSGGVLRASTIDLSANASGGLNGSGVGGNATGGSVNLALSGDSLIATSFIGLTADAFGGDGPGALTGGNATGGSATVQITGALLNVPSISLSAGGRGGTGLNRSGNGTGGTASFTLLDGAFVQSDSLFLSATGTGGSGSFDRGAPSRRGGDGIGGDVSLVFGAAAPTTIGSVQLIADGFGGIAEDANFTGPVRGGDGTGGRVNLSQSDGTIDLASLYLSANAAGGDGHGAGGIGGNALGGNANLLLSSGTGGLAVENDTTLHADAHGGFGAARSGDATGGTSFVSLSQFGRLDSSTLLVSANANGGGNGLVSQSVPSDTLIGGAATGGSVRIDNSGTISTGDIKLETNGIGGGALSATGVPTGGNGTGGSAQINALAGQVSTVSLHVAANGTGGSSGNAAGFTGFGQGGAITMLLNGGNLSVSGGTLLEANASVNDRGGGVDRGARGGSINLDVIGPSVFSTPGLAMYTQALAANLGPLASSGGNFTGGSIFVSAQFGGSLTAGSIQGYADARSANVTGTAGFAQGGSFNVRSITGTIASTTTGLIFDASATGGNGTVGGNGTGGNISLTADDGTISAAGSAFSSELRADGTAGSSTAPAGETRTRGYGGTIDVRTTPTANSLFNFDNLTVSASGIGTFDGIFGGDGQGGSVNFEMAGGQYLGTSLNVIASGEGGIAGFGGGGHIDFRSSAGETNVQFLFLSADGTGGRGLDGQEGTTGAGGSISLTVLGGAINGQFFSASADGFGGRGGRSANGTNGPIAAGAGGYGFGGQIVGEIGETGSINLTQLFLGANGRGGDGGNHDVAVVGPALIGRGGNSQGGFVEFKGFGGTINDTQLVLAAEAAGGIGGRFYDASGNGPTVPTSGTDSDAGGGFAFGGHALLRLRANIGGQYAIDTSATAGEGGSGFAGQDGGTAYGGLSELIVEDFDAGQINVFFTSNGNGGRGGRGTQGKGGNGGMGYGGTARLVVTGANGVGSILDDRFDIRGFGGSGGNADQFVATLRGFDGGNGGQGTGGTIDFVAQAGGNLTVAASNGEGDIRSEGRGGLGGSGSNNDFGTPGQASFGGNGGFGGFGIGGTILLTADGGFIDTESDFGAFFFRAQGAGGEGGFGGRGVQTVTFDPITNDPIFNGGNGFDAGFGGDLGGRISFTANNLDGVEGEIFLPDTEFDVSGTYAGRVELHDLATGAGLAFRSLSVFANGFDLNNGSDMTQRGSGLFVESTDGAITVRNSANFRATTTLGGTAARFYIRATAAPETAESGGLIVGGTFRFIGGSIGGVHLGNPDIDHVNATISAANISIDAAGSINFAPSTLLRASNRITLNAALSNPFVVTDGSIRFGGLSSGGSQSITGLSINGVQALAGGSFTSNSISATDISFVEAAFISMDAGTTLHLGSFLSTGSAEFASGGDLILDEGSSVGFLSGTSTGGNIRLGSLTSIGPVTFDANGTLQIAQLIAISRTGNVSFPDLDGSITLTSGGELKLGSLESASFVTIESGSLNAQTGSILASGDIIVTTGGNLMIGSANGSTVTFDSGGTISFTEVIGRNGANLRSVGALSGGLLGTSSGDADLISTGGDISLTQANISGAFTVNAARNVTLGNFVSDFDADVTAGGNADVTSGRTRGQQGNNSTSAPGVPVGQAGGAVTSNILFNVGGTLSLGALESLGNISITAASVTGATSSLLANGNVGITTTGAAQFGTLDAQSALINSGGALRFTRSTTLRETGITASGVTGDELISTTRGLTVNAGSGGITIDRISADTGVSLVSVGLIDVGALTVADGDALIDGDGDVIVDSGTVNYLLNVSAGGNATLGTLSAGTVQVTAGGAITATSLTTTGFVQSTQNLTGAAGDIRLNAGSAVNLGALNAAAGVNITGATLTGASSSLTARDGVQITTTGSATLGTIDAAKSLINSGPLTFNRITTSGNSDIVAAGTVTGGSLSSTAGTLAITTTAGGNVLLGSVSGANGATIIGAGLADIDSITTSRGNVLVDMAGNVTVDAANVAGSFDIDSDADVVIGTTTSTGPTRVRATGAITAASITTTTGTGQTTEPALIRLAAGGAVNLGALNSANAIDIAAATLNGAASSLRAATNVGIASRGAASFGTIDAASALVTASGPLSFNRVTTSGDASLSATGAITGTLVETTGAGAVVNMTGSSITQATIRAAGDARLSATGGALNVTSLASGGRVSATGSSVTIGGTTNLDFSTLAATAGDASANLTSGALRVRSGTATGTLSLTTGSGSMVIDAASAAAITINAGTTVSLIGPITATGTLAITAQRNVGVNGIATGQTVRIRSGDISIGSSGRIGTGGTTTLVDLTNGDGTSRTFIGGDDTTSGYSLSAAELLRIFGGNIAIHAPRAQTQGGGSVGSTRPPDVVIGAFTLNGGASTTGNLGSSGTLTIDTPGKARVTGAVQLNGMNSGNGFGLTANDSIEVILGQGSIRLSNGSALSGTLSLVSDDVVVATSAAITDIAAATTTDAIDTRLAANDGVVSEDGALSAGTINFEVIRGLYVQNSGVSDRFADRRGFTANRVNISTESSGTRIVVNGRVADDTGLLRTGLDAIKQIQINGITADLHTATGGGFDPESTINGCTIVRASSCSVGFILPPVQDVIEEVVDDDGGDDGNNNVTGNSDAAQQLIDLRDVETLPNEPLIDDPVTGTGNDDLWTGPEG